MGFLLVWTKGKLKLISSWIDAVFITGITTNQALTCLNSTVETLEKSVKYVQS